MYLQNNKNKGFTLIELIVSLGIFSIIITIVAGTYFSLVSASVNMRTSTSAINNITTALNEMSDDIRSGTCKKPGQCTVAGNSFTFTNSLGFTVKYSLCNSQICKTVGTGTSYALTHAPVKVSALLFSPKTYSNTSGAVKAYQTLTIINVGGEYTLQRKTQPTSFHLETVVVPRMIYIK